MLQKCSSHPTGLVNYFGNRPAKLIVTYTDVDVKHTYLIADCECTEIGHEASQ